MKATIVTIGDEILIKQIVDKFGFAKLIESGLKLMK
jgi:molybdopterin-biosynthesis enzyme MoeA-like protein